MRVEIYRAEIIQSAARLGVRLTDEQAQDLIIQHSGEVESLCTALILGMRLPKWIGVTRERRGSLPFSGIYDLPENRKDVEDRRHYCAHCAGRIFQNGSCACSPAPDPRRVYHGEPDAPAETSSEAKA